MSKAYTPTGQPRYIHCHDTGPDTTIDRYTVRFTQIRDGWQHLLCMSASPFHPQGFCQHTELPSYERLSLGKRIHFEHLPPDCQRAVMQDYEEIWGTPS